MHSDSRLSINLFSTHEKLIPTTKIQKIQQNSYKIFRFLENSEKFKMVSYQNITHIFVKICFYKTKLARYEKERVGDRQVQDGRVKISQVSIGSV